MYFKSKTPVRIRVSNTFHTVGQIAVIVAAEDQKVPHYKQEVTLCRKCTNIVNNFKILKSPIIMVGEPSSEFSDFQAAFIVVCTSEQLALK